MWPFKNDDEEVPFNKIGTIPKFNEKFEIYLILRPVYKRYEEQNLFERIFNITNFKYDDYSSYREHHSEENPLMLGGDIINHLLNILEKEEHYGFEYKVFDVILSDIDYCFHSKQYRITFNIACDTKKEARLVYDCLTNKESIPKFLKDLFPEHDFLKKDNK